MGKSDNQEEVLNDKALNTAYERGYMDGKVSTEDSISLRQMSLDRALKALEHWSIYWSITGNISQEEYEEIIIQFAEKFREYVVNGEVRDPSSKE